MAILGRLKSNGVMQVYARIDEISDPSRNAGITSEGILYGALFDENMQTKLSSNTPLRISNDKKIVAYNYFDERTLSINNDIFDSLVSLSSSLRLITSVTNTNFKNVQNLIQTSHPSFNVFAVTTKNYNSESLQGIGTPSGKHTFTSPGFVYSTLNSNILSTGNTIVDMNNGFNYGIPEINNYKWMAASIFDGTTNGFLGTLVWIFTNDIIDISNNIVGGGKPVTTTKSIFSPTLGILNYMRVYQVVIGPNRNVLTSDVTGNAGWGYSNNQFPDSVTGYNSTSQFSFDDGLWAFVVGGKVDGNDGPDYRTTNGYGFGNYNNTDPSAALYWNGSNVVNNNYVAFIFTGDA
jgi:hypothetical protein